MHLASFAWMVAATVVTGSGCRRGPPDTDVGTYDTRLGTDGTGPTDADTDTDTDTDTDGTGGDTGPCATDADGDGVGACDDCDDADPLTFPGAPERCDLLDNDCDGLPLDDESPDCMACDAAGMWLPTRGLDGDALNEALHGLTAAQSCFDYSAETTYMFVTLDNVGGYVECVYTGRETPIIGGNKPSETDMNTEHSWPQSLGADVVPAKCDLHHLYPTDSDTNNMRGNLPFGEVVTDTETVDGGSRLGTSASGVTVFEPRDAHKGNVARSMAYFAMRYGYPLPSADVTMYRAWSALDPVDDAELTRTTAIGARQGAVNPYVVCPFLLDRW